MIYSYSAAGNRLDRRAYVVVSTRTTYRHKYSRRNSRTAAAAGPSNPKHVRRCQLLLLRFMISMSKYHEPSSCRHHLINDTSTPSWRLCCRPSLASFWFCSFLRLFAGTLFRVEVVAATSCPPSWQKPSCIHVLLRGGPVPQVVQLRHMHSSEDNAADVQFQ